jgi:hypothetical protein
MTVPSPVERVAGVLEKAGYRRISTPLEIAGLKYDLPAAFVGSTPSPDLIVVADSAVEEAHRILRKIEGVGRALDVVGSKRPLTAVIAGPRPTTAVLVAMSKVCRVLPIGVISDVDADMVLRNWLAVLMPLDLPAPGARLADPLKEITAQLDGLSPDVRGLADFAPQGADAVQTKLYEIITDALNEPWEGDLDLSDLRGDLKDDEL